MANFNLPFGVYISNSNPIDASRYVVNNLTERGNLITFGRAYEGLLSYVKSEKKLYILKNLSPIVWEQVPDASTLANNDVSINSIYTQLGNLDTSIDVVWTKVDGSLLNVDSSLGAIWVKLGYVDISLNNIDFSSLEASINDIWIKLDDVDLSLNDIYSNLGDLDTSMNGVWIKTSYLDTSIQSIDLKNINQDTSINSIWTKIGNQDSSFNLFLPKTGGTMTGGLQISTDGLNVTNDVSVRGTIYSNNLIADGSSIFNGPVSFISDVFFEGSAYFVDVNSLDISTSFLDLNSGLVGAPPLSLQSGIIIKRGNENPYVFVYDEDIQTFRIGISYLESSIHYSDASTQAVATRENEPPDNFIGYWSASENMFRFRSPESISDVSLLYVDTQIGYVESSINGIYDYLDGTETVSRTIYIDPSIGNDITGNGTIGTPYATILKCLQTVKTIINGAVTITIQALPGNYTFNWAPIEKEFSRFKVMNASSAIKSFIINGSQAPIASGFTLTADASNPWVYHCSSTLVSNAYQDKFLLVGGSYYPIMSNDTSTLRTFVGLGAGTSVAAPDVIFNITDRRINIGWDYFSGFQGGMQMSWLVLNITNGGSPAGTSISIKSGTLDILESTINVQTLQISGGGEGGTFLRSNLVASTTTGTALTQSNALFQLDYAMIRKTGTINGVGVLYGNNYQRIEGALYISNFATGLQYNSGVYLYDLSGRHVILNATTGFTLRNGTYVTFAANNVYIDGSMTTLISTGETLYSNYQFHLLTLQGTPSSFFAAAINSNGLVVPSKNICINVSGSLATSITFPNGTTQTTSFDASVNSVWTKINQIDTSIVNSDSSMWVKFGYVDTSLNSIWTKLGQVDNSLNNVETGVGLFNWDTSSGTINVDMSKDKRIKLTLNGNATLNLTNLSSTYSRSVVMDVKATGALRTITWDASLTTNNWADGDILSGIDTSTYAFAININTNGSDKSDVTINWIKKGL